METSGNTFHKKSKCFLAIRVAPEYVPDYIWNTNRNLHVLVNMRGQPTSYAQPFIKLDISAIFSYIFFLLQKSASFWFSDLCPALILIVMVQRIFGEKISPIWKFSKTPCFPDFNPHFITTLYLVTRRECQLFWFKSYPKIRHVVRKRPKNPDYNVWNVYLKFRHVPVHLYREIYRESVKFVIVFVFWLKDLISIPSKTL